MSMSRGIYIVKTIPPLRINLASRGTAPDQKVKTPSSLNILAAQAKLLLYSLRASMDCMLLENQTGFHNLSVTQLYRVLMVSRG